MWLLGSNLSVYACYFTWIQHRNLCLWFTLTIMQFSHSFLYKYLNFYCAKVFVFFMMDDVKFVEKSYCRSICLLQGVKTDCQTSFYGFELKELHRNNSFYLFDFFSFCSGKSMILMPDLLICARMGPWRCLLVNQC